MERVLYNLHSNVCGIALRHTSSKTRSLAEHGLLLVALAGFGVLILAHLSFVHRCSSALSLLQQRPSSKTIPLHCLERINGFERNANVTHVLLSESDTSVAYSISKQEEEYLNCTDDDDSTMNMKEETCSDSSDGVCQQQEESTCVQAPLSEQDIILSYSPTMGFLFLPLSTRLQHNISTQYVYVSKQDTHCFGEPFLQALVERIFGVDTVALNWLVAAHDGRGYLHNPRTRRVMDLSASGHYSLWKSTTTSSSLDSKQHYRKTLFFKAGVILTSVFLFFITTTLVSFTLRETQDRMLQFTFQLQRYVGADRPLHTLILTHVVENLVFVPIMVGMMFFLIEFYGGDKLLAFMVLSIVWVCEVFSTIAIRSIQGMQFFPKIFFLLFTLFHVYFFSCPFGFSYTALASTACFMIHSMVFFWHRYELPAVAHGLVSIHNPRMGAAPAPDPLMVPILPDGNEQHASESRLLLPPRNPMMLHPHGHSHPSMSSLGRNSTSRPPSSTGLPFQGDDDGDGSESYMYFMNGEVVMHRERNTRGRSHSISTHGSLEQNETASLNGTPDSNPSVPQRILATPMAIVDSAVNNATVSSEAVAPITRREVLDRTESPQRQSQEVEDLDATPRIGSASSQVIDATTAANGPVPMFPMGAFGRQQRDTSN